MGDETRVELFISLRGSAAETSVRAQALENAGWDGVGVGDHRAGARHMWAALGAAAASTSRVKLLSSFANNLLRHPVDFARGAITVNALASGRFEAGLGAGWQAEEMRFIGDALPSPRERIDRLREAVEIVGTLFRESSCQHRGSYYTVDVPEFAWEGPPPPLVAAVGGPRACRLIAPLVDRVEVMFGPAVATGDLEPALFAQLTEEALESRVAAAREASSNVLIGVGVFVAAGVGPQIDGLRASGGTGLQGALIGEAESVADAVRSLANLSIDRVTLIPMTPDTAEHLGPVLLP